MIVIPAIDLINGAVVRLHQGDFSAQTTFAHDPVELASQYAQQGAQWLHLVDLDGAKAGAPAQTGLISQMQAAAQVPVQAGGGVRSANHVQALLHAGAARVVVGSVALACPDLFEQWLTTFGGQRLVLALDVRLEGQTLLPASHGWTQTHPTSVDDILQRLTQVGLEWVLMTDIDRDGTGNGPNVDLYQRMKSSYPDLQWIASGGVASAGCLQALEATGVEAVVVGKALLDGSITPGDVL